MSDFLPEGEWGKGRGRGRGRGERERPLRAVIIPGGRPNANIRAGNHLGT